MRTTDTNQPVLTVAQMRAAENALIEGGTGVHQLMQRAGCGAGQIIWQIGGMMPVTILCGPGNNGGDGYVIAQFLCERGVPVRVVEAMPPATEAAKRARVLYAGTVTSLTDAKSAPLLVDCLFGSGLTRAVGSGLWDAFSGLLAGAKRRIAIDVPSGVQSDSGELLNPLPPFTHTIALGAWKQAHFMGSAAAIMGQKCLVDIGVEPPPFAARRLARPTIAGPEFGAHKYSRGKLAIVAGDMGGAAHLAAIAAQAAGAGYVEVLTPRRLALSPDIVQRVYTGGGAFADTLHDPRISAILAGPGLGCDDVAHGILATVLAADKPVLLDADALHLLPEHDHAACNAPIIVTPHAGEFKVLHDGNGDKLSQTRDAAAKLGVYVLHKGPDTVLAAPLGETILCDPASSWLSVAGSGDVLAGAIAARLAVTGDPMRSMAEGQWLHSRAARLAGAGFSASELAAKLRCAFAECV